MEDTWNSLLMRRRSLNTRCFHLLTLDGAASKRDSYQIISWAGPKVRAGTQTLLSYSSHLNYLSWRHEKERWIRPCHSLKFCLTHALNSWRAELDSKRAGTISVLFSLQAQEIRIGFCCWPIKQQVLRTCVPFVLFAGPAICFKCNSIPSSVHLLIYDNSSFGCRAPPACPPVSEFKSEGVSNRLALWWRHLVASHGNTVLSRLNTKGFRRLITKVGRWRRHQTCTNLPKFRMLVSEFMHVSFLKLYQTSVE